MFFPTGTPDGNCRRVLVSHQVTMGESLTCTDAYGLTTVAIFYGGASASGAFAGRSIEPTNLSCSSPPEQSLVFRSACLCNCQLGWQVGLQSVAVGHPSLWSLSILFSD